MLCNVGVWDRRNQVESCPRANPASSANRDCSPFASKLWLIFVKNCSQKSAPEETMVRLSSSNADMTHSCHSIVSRLGGSKVVDPNQVSQRVHWPRVA